MAKKRGRPKKKGVERYANGKIKYNDAVAPSAARRIREHAVKLAVDDKLGTELGRRYLYGDLTSKQFATACKVGEIVGRNDFYMGVRRATKSPSYELGFKQASKDSDIDVRLVKGYGKSAEASRNDPTPFELRAKAARESFWWLWSLCTWRELFLLERLCVDDELILPNELATAKERLDKLAEKWGQAAAPKKQNQSRREFSRNRENTVAAI